MSNMENEKKIEIPFGANDSELKGWEYTIPKGMEAIIKDGKVIVREKDSEDERIRKRLLWFLAHYEGRWDYPETRMACRNWLEKQKEQKPVDDFEKWLDEWYQGSKEAGGDVVMSESEFKNWSRGIRNMYERKPVEWSEEDEAMRNNIIRVLSCFTGNVECESNPSLSTSYPIYTREMDWLKSLRPQSHWKPTEEQMRSLLNAEGILRSLQYDGIAINLAELYEQLKKLM